MIDVGACKIRFASSREALIRIITNEIHLNTIKEIASRRLFIKVANSEQVSHIM